MKDPLVSVILTSYNKAQMLKQAICSVVAQTYDNWECIVIDDLSGPEVKDVLAWAIDTDEKIHWRDTILGPHETPESLNRYAYNINSAVKEYCKGQLITYLCDDDLYAPMRLEVMTAFLEQNPDAKIVYGKQLAYGYGKVIMREAPPITWHAAMRVDHSSVMHYRECFDKAGGWDEDASTIACGDAAFWRRLNEHWPFYGIDEVLDVHRFNERSVNALRDQASLGVAN